MWPYFTIPLEGHIRQVWLYDIAKTQRKHDLVLNTCFMLRINIFMFLTDFRWIAKDLCEIHLQVFNPMPEELKIAQMVCMV